MRIVQLVGVLAGAALAAGGAPAQADSLSIGISIGGPPPPPVVVAAPPALVVVPGSPVYYAPSLGFNYFFYARRYYTYHEGAWFQAPAFNGPWIVTPVVRVPPPVLAVPVAYYKVPPGHARQGGPPPWAGSKHHAKHGHAD